MSYALAPPPEREPGRPVAVTLASLIMCVIAGLALVSAITTLAAMGSIVAGFRERAAGTDATPADIDNLAAAVRVISIVAAIVLLIVAVALVALAVGNLRGSNLSRILTWVLCGLGVLCGCCGVVGTLGEARAVFSTSDTAATPAEQLGQALSESYPGWWLGVNGTLSGLGLLGYIAVAVLLALPTANAFFRKPAPPTWQPPAR